MSGVLLWAGVGVLGGLGAVARFVAAGQIMARLRSGVPFGILAVNLTGAFALGVLAGLGLHGDRRLLAGTALLGAYTTFSTWMLDSHRLWSEGRRGVAALNLVVSLALGLGLVALGRTTGAAL